MAHPFPPYNGACVEQEWPTQCSKAPRGVARSSFSHSAATASAESLSPAMSLTLENFNFSRSPRTPRPLDAPKAVQGPSELARSSRLQWPSTPCRTPRSNLHTYLGDGVGGWGGGGGGCVCVRVGCHLPRVVRPIANAVHVRACESTWLDVAAPSQIVRLEKSCARPRRWWMAAKWFGEAHPALYST